jgi:transposase
MNTTMQKERDKRIIVLREMGYSQRKVAKLSRLSRRRIRQIIERDRPDLIGDIRKKALKHLTEKEKDFIVLMRLQGEPFKRIELMTKIPSWKAREFIKNELPGLVDGGQFYRETDGKN